MLLDLSFKGKKGGKKSTDQDWAPIMAAYQVLAQKKKTLQTHPIKTNNSNIS